LSDLLHDDEFLTWLAYLGDVFSRPNDPNLRLQGLSATILNVQDKIEAMIKKKLELFSVCINNDNTQVFPSLYDFLCANEQAYGQCQMWYSEAPWVSWARNYAGTFPKRMTQTTGFDSFFIPCLSPLTDIWTRERHQNCNKRFCENVI
jgi:hypothetical protein